MSVHEAIELAPRAADILMPMHLRLDGDGQVIHGGPSLCRLVAGRRLLGAGFFEVFDVLRPSGLTAFDVLRRTAGKPLTLALRSERPVQFRGVATMAGAEQMIVNLALGLGDIADLGGAPLTSRDFAPTDPTVDMLYLIEANRAAYAESRRLIEQLNGAKLAAELQADTDTLTGLRNRRALDTALNGLVADGIPFALAQIDLDFFKDVNDTHGHAAGDHVLGEVSRILRDITREADTVARVGGDEFVVILRDLTDARTIGRIARRLIERLERPMLFDAVACHISGSIGIAVSTDYDPVDPVRMAADADRALYASKAAGRARHTLWRPGASDAASLATPAGFAEAGGALLRPGGSVRASPWITAPLAPEMPSGRSAGGGSGRSRPTRPKLPGD